MAKLPNRQRIWEIPIEGVDQDSIENMVKIAKERVAVYYNPKLRDKPGAPMAKPGTHPSDFPAKIRYDLDKTIFPNGIAPAMFLGIYEIEREALVQTANLLNHPEPIKTGGFFLSGGTESINQSLWNYRNMYFTKRLEQKYPNKNNKVNIGKEGLFTIVNHTEKPVILSSINAHFALKKAARILGIGTDNIVEYGLDENYRPDPESARMAVRETLESGRQIMVNYVTMGDTERGMFTDVRTIDSVVTDEIMDFGGENYIPPVVVDAAAQYLFAAVMEKSNKYSKSIPEWDFRINNVRAIVVDPHKNQITYPAGMLLLRNQSDTEFTNMNASYLHIDSLSRVNSLSEEEKHDSLALSTIPTSRSGSAGVATWTYYLNEGISGIKKKKEKIWSIVNTLKDLINDSNKFNLVCEPDSSVVAFGLVDGGKKEVIEVYKLVNENPDDFWYISKSESIKARTVDDLNSSRDMYGINLHVMEHNTIEDAKGIVQRLKEVYKKVR